MSEKDSLEKIAKGYNAISQTEMQEALRLLAKLSWAYFESLRSQGFSAAEAMYLVEAWQKIIIPGKQDKKETKDD